MPIYTFFMLLTVVGLSEFVDFMKKCKSVRVLVSLYLTIVMGNMALSGLLIVQNALTTEARIDAIDYCKENGITKENTVYEGYTPLSLTVGGTFSEGVVDAKQNLVLAPEIRYVILSSSMYERYFAEPERYVEMIAAYHAVEKECELIYEKGGSYYQSKEWAFFNIICSLKGLVKHDADTLTGPVIKIYKVIGSNSGKGEG